MSRHDFWPWAEGIREARRAWLLRADRSVDAGSMDAAAAELRRALADGPRDAKELGSLGSGFLGRLGSWIDLVRVPPSGTWERRRADRLALAEQWLGPSESSPAEGLGHLVRSYLRAFGPAPWRDIAAWAGVSTSDVRAGAADLALVRYRDERGGELLDLPDAPLPHPDTPAPVRFLAHWDASLLVHARRTGLLPEVASVTRLQLTEPLLGGHLPRRRPGRGRLVAPRGPRRAGPLRGRSRPDQQDAVEAERAALEAFHA